MTFAWPCLLGKNYVDPATRYDIISTEFNCLFLKDRLMNYSFRTRPKFHHIVFRLFQVSRSLALKSHHSEIRNPQADRVAR